MLLVTSFGFFLILVFNLFFKIQISDPLLELTKAFKQIGRGNLEYQIPTKKKDEFGEAFLGFNRMAKSLKENYEKLREIQKDLEKKVKKRTLELEEAKTVLEIKVAARTRQLKELADELKQRVEERTKELQERVQELEKMRRALLNILEDLREETERAETEKRKTLAIVENFTDGILVLDKEDRIVLCNPQAETMLQIKRTEVQNEFFKKIRENFCFKKITEIAGENLRPISRQELALREDLIVEVSIIPLFFEGQQIGKIIILHDITREKTIEKIKTEFVSISAHQLRTPLSAIKWSLRMLLDGDLGSLSKEQREFLEKTYQANQRLINLVNDLLDVTRIEEGRYLFRLEPLDFEKLATNICEIYKKEAEKKNIKFEFFVKKKSSLFIKGDSEKINLAMQNLIENAIKYTLPGGKVEVRLEEKEKEILFSVKDTGIGIPENQKHRIFSKFFRGSNVQTLDTEGTGLGLFITKNIIEAHGGKIWFESKENVGTTFYFTLPLIEKKSK
ncbi:HAMP domain-containing protein, partial [Candidatus Parcubacteria bacterium]|nr:HAMP domain-containing protein [Candidatus Parcubacteria bacterium]